MPVPSRLLAPLCLMAAASSQALTVNSLPYAGSPDWSEVIFAGTRMAHDGSSTTLHTARVRGVWFGWSGSNDKPAGWTPGSSADGNHLALTLSFSSGSTDWSAYLFDRSHEAALLFLPTGCDNACYGQPGAQGVNLLHGDAADPRIARLQFVPMATLDQPHSFEFLLKNGQVSYRIDGRVVFSGAAFNTASASKLLVIGDGSGSTLSGEGSMTVHAVAMDNAPTAAALVSTVPEPASWALLLAGAAGLAGWLKPSVSARGDYPRRVVPGRPAPTSHSG